MARATREPSGPPSSSYATSPQGVAAYADLLSSVGHPIDRLRGSLADLPPDPRQTVVLFDVDTAFSAEEVDVVQRLVRDGGRLVVAGDPPTSLLRQIVDTPPEWSSTSAGLARPASPAPEVENIRTVLPTGEGAFTAVGSATPLLRGEDRVLAAIDTSEAGIVVMVATSTPFQNRLLARADNAAFAVAVAGGDNRPVVFVESVHGYGEAIGLSALPQKWWWVLGGLVVAALVLMWARGMRLGPAEAEQREMAPPRRDYVEALAASLARTGASAAVARPLYDRMQRTEGEAATPPETAEQAMEVGRVFARRVTQRGGRL
jgi:hypothetical protein